MKVRQKVFKSSLTSQQRYEEAAARVVVTRVPIPAPPPVDGYSLTIILTANEAADLRSMCQLIGGDPKLSTRGVMDALDAALQDNGATISDRCYVSGEFLMWDI